MLSRKKMTRKSLDKKVFRNTAIKTRRVNVTPTIMRGGIRL